MKIVSLEEIELNDAPLSSRNEWEQNYFDELINQIEEPKDKAAMLLKVMEFFMAKHKAIEHTGVEPAKHRTPEEIQQDLKELNGE